MHTHTTHPDSLTDVLTLVSQCYPESLSHIHVSQHHPELVSLLPAAHPQYTHTNSKDAQVRTTANIWRIASKGTHLTLLSPSPCLHSSMSCLCPTLLSPLHSLALPHPSALHLVGPGRHSGLSAVSPIPQPFPILSKSPEAVAAGFQGLPWQRGLIPSPPGGGLRTRPATPIRGFQLLWQPLQA